MIYLDYAATAPLAPAAAAAMAEAASRWANPSSVHAPGRAARAALEEARAGVADALGWRGTVIFTSGGTEALGIALTRSTPSRRIVSAIEHAAVLGRTPAAAVIPVDAQGRVDLAALERLLASGAGLVAIMHANNETGAVQPIAEAAALARAAGAVLLSDCVQSAGRLPLPQADLIAVSAHKLGGPPGIGALLVRDPGLLTPEGGAGGQEGGYRAGTENWLGALGFAAALRTRTADPGWTVRVAALRLRLERALEAAGGIVIAQEAERLPHITCVRLPGAEAMTQLIALDLEGFAVSAGAACSSGRVKSSHVLTAMGLSPAAAGEALRISLGWDTTQAQIDSFAIAYAALARRLLRRAA